MEMPSSFDPNQTQWYPADPAAASPSPVEDPEVKRKKWTRIGVGAGIGVLVLVIGIFFARSAWEQHTANTTERVQKQVAAKDECDTARDPAKCAAAIPEKLAREEGDPEFCVDLSEGQEKDSCIFLAAFTAKEIDVCESIVDTERKDACHDAILTTQLQAQGRTEEGCAQYRNAEAQTSCLSLVLWERALKGDCSDERISDDLCAEAKYTAQALSAHDPELCALIRTDEREEDCRDQVGPGDVDGDGLSAEVEAENGSDDHLVDTDGDGLTDAQEIQTYATNPAKSDTDGDSYSDGTEVAGGYDPLH